MKAAPLSPKTTAWPRTKPSAVRREELLDAAEKLFLEQGTAATSVDQIVAAAEVAKGTFYLHFPSKEQLLAALQQRFVAGFCHHLQEAMDQHQPDDWQGRLRAWVEAGVSGYLDRVALHDVVFIQFRPEDRRARHDNPVVDQLAEFLSQGTWAGAWSVGDPHLIATMLFHALHGTLDDALAATPKVDSKRLASTLEVFFRRVVGLELPK